MGRRKGLAILALIPVFAAACGSGDSTEEATDTTGTATTAVAAAQTTMPPAETEATEGQAEESDAPTQDAGDIDWATVDLTTIDWATIDVSQIDFQAITENPTAGDLDEETVALINSRIDPGSATLTIGDQTWEFATFVCAFGHDATQSDVYAFSSDTRGEHEGATVQMQANIRDESGEGRFEGPDLTHEVYITDVSDFENPSIDLNMTAPEGITIDGSELVAEGIFDDELTEEVEEIPGSLQATCGTMSRR